MFVFAWPLLGIGLLSLVLGGRLLWTGRNFGGILGRGFTRSDELRMKRAPAVYFRALGTMASIPAVMLLFFGVVLVLVPTQPDSRLVALVFGVAGVLLIAEVLSVVWLLLISSRYKLFRWDKP